MKNEHVFLKEWKKEQTRLLMLIDPSLSKDEIKDYLDDVIDKKLKNRECVLSNNYQNKAANTTLLDLLDFIDMTKPITTGGGVLFKNQHEALNPPSHFLNGAIKKRKSIKSQLKSLKPGSFQYMMVDLRQMTEKVVANSYYGASGNEISQFYNLYTALATTATGQSLISTMMCAFESFYANNVKFYDVSDFVLYVGNSLKKTVEEVKIKDMPEIDDDAIFDKVYKMFKSPKILDEEKLTIIRQTIANLNKKEKQLVYYSSNLFKFIEIDSVKNLLLKIVYTVDSFKDPNSVPKSIQKYLDNLWDALNYWVVYNYPTFNRINRLKFEPRKCIVTIDTDSNMICLSKFVNFMLDNIDIEKTISKDNNEIMYICVNTMAYVLTQYTKVILANYSKIANIPDDYAPNLNMKNELLFLRMVLTKNKKNYVGIIRLREGAELIPEKLDVKGIPFMKSVAARETKAYFSNLVKTHVLYAEPISPSQVIIKVKEFARYIENSILSGEKRFLNPLSVKEPEAYDKPFSNQGVRGTYVWNSVYPDQEITLPDKITVARVKMEKLENIEKLKISHPDIYDRLVNNIYKNPECSFRDKGISVIAIPSQVELVPEWITQYIDKDKIINDNVSKFYSIMESLGLSMLDTRSNSPHFSNIIQF